MTSNNDDPQFKKQVRGVQRGAAESCGDSGQQAVKSAGISCDSRVWSKGSELVGSPSWWPWQPCPGPRSSWIKAVCEWHSGSAEHICESRASKPALERARGSPHRLTNGQGGAVWNAPLRELEVWAPPRPSAHLQGQDTHPSVWEGRNPTPPCCTLPGSPPTRKEAILPQETPPFQEPPTGCRSPGSRFQRATPAPAMDWLWSLSQPLHHNPLPPSLPLSILTGVVPKSCSPRSRLCAKLRLLKKKHQGHRPESRAEN